MTLENVVPFGHAVNLMLVLALTGTGCQIALGPLAVASGQLSDGARRMTTNVTFDIIGIGITSLTLGATMGHVMFIVETASLIVTVEVALHTGGIGGELGNQGVF